jgi:23S rRNA (guanosine2251-2'-O)-methyltransferase
MKKRSMLELQRLSVEEFKEQPKTPLVIMLDNVRSALNVGSAFRTADAFAIKSIVLCGISAQPPHREISKTALGAHQSVDWEYFEETTAAIEAYKKQGYKIYAIEQAFESTSLQDFQWPQGPIAIIMGNEVEGVSQKVMDLVDGCIEIPQYGTKHSFNISVSIGIVLWELFRKHKNWA